MERYLFLFTISPVQSFIAQARKTQDLYSGSLLLSTLIQEAADKLGKLQSVQSCNIIFPDILKIKSAPNRFIAEIECQKIEDTGEALKTYILKQFNKKAYAALGTYKVNGSNQQVENFLQVFWAAIPNRDRINYKRDYEQLEKLIAAVKNTRYFEQYSEPQGMKCSLCGERTALIHKATQRRKWRYAQGAHHLKNDDQRLIENEGLCAVCWTKRNSKKWSTENTDFPSTASICLADSLSKLSPTMLNYYEKNIIPFDAQLYFRENLSQRYFERHGITFSNGFDCVKEWDRIHQHAILKDVFFPKYYALLMLDGDNVGDWMAGRNHDKSVFQDSQLREFHENVTKKLGKYAQNVTQVFSDPSIGKLVYAGGDDVLAFINLNHLTKTLKTLRDKIPKLDGTKNYTASAGVVITHYKIPLGEVIKWARVTEKKAKQELDYKKDKLAISVLKHSGEIVQCTTPWKIDDSYLQLDLFEQLVGLWDADILSGKFVQVLLSTFYKFFEEETDKQYSGVPSGLIHSEIKRTILRSLKEKEKKYQAKLLISLLCDFYDSLDIANFISFIRIVDFIYRRTRSWL